MKKLGLFIFFIMVSSSSLLFKSYANERKVKHSNINPMVKNGITAPIPITQGNETKPDLSYKYDDTTRKLQKMPCGCNTGSLAPVSQCTTPVFKGMLNDKNIRFRKDIKNIQANGTAAKEISAPLFSSATAGVFSQSSTGSIAGEVSSSSCGVDNPIYISVWDNSSYLSGLLGQTNILGPGTYSITNLPVGIPVWIRALCDLDGSGFFPECGDYLGVYSGNPLSITGDHTGIDITVNTLATCGSISGTISCSGCGTDEIIVYAYAGDSSDVLGQTSIYGSGSYTISLLPINREIRVFAWWDQEQTWSGIPYCGDYQGEYGGGFITLSAANPDISAVNITLAEIQCGTIAGNITSNSSPIANLYVHVQDWDTGIWVSDDFTDGTGTYSIDVPPAGYRVRACASCSGLPYVDKYLDAYCAGDAEKVTINAGETKVKNFTLEAGVEISGKIRRESDGSLIPNSVMNIWNGDCFGTGMWTETGSYSLRVPPSIATEESTYYWAKSSTDCIYVDEFYGEATCPINENRIIATSDQHDIDVHIAPGNTITGTVRLPENQNFNDKWVALSANSNNPRECGDTGITPVDNTNTGTFCLMLEPATDYRLRIPPWACGGYITGYYCEDGPGNFCIWSYNATPVDISNGSQASMDITLQEGGSISGRVILEPSGNYEGGSVYADIFNEERGSWYGFQWADINPDDGTYMLQCLTTGRYRIRANVGCYIEEYYDDAINSEDATYVEVIAPFDITGINFTLAKGGSVAGKVIDSLSGNPIPDVIIRTSNYFQRTITDGNGDYTLCALPTGDYYIFTDTDMNYVNECYNNVQTDYYVDRDCCEVISIEPPNEILNVNFSLDQGGTIAGTVTAAGSGTPIEGIYVNAYGCDNSTTNAVTDINGKYTIGGLPSGSYLVSTSPQNSGYMAEYYNGALDLESDKVEYVSVSMGENKSGIDFELSVGVSINGSIMADDTALPIPNLAVLALSNDPHFMYDFYSVTNANGEYSIVGLDPVQCYKLLVLSWDSGYAIEYFDNKVSLKQATPVCPPATINFGLPRAARIYGSVTDEQGGGIDGQYVIPFDYDTRESLMSLGYVAGYTENGSYDIPNVSPGSYAVGVYDYSGNNYRTEYFDNVTDYDSATEIVLGPGDEYRCDFQLVKSSEVPTIGVGNVSGSVGETISVPVSINNFSNQFFAVVGNVNFNNDALRYEGFTPGDIEGELFYTSFSPVEINMCDNHSLQYLIEPYSFSSGTLLNLQFTILCVSGDIPILFEDLTGVFNVQNGKITVTECISDSDCDSVLNSEDNCPYIANPNQEDGDGDGVGDGCDNCPSDPNPNQADADGDCMGDSCDAFPTTFDPTQRETDGDGIGDVCDNAPYVYNPDQANSDTDYISNALDNCPEQYNPCQEDTYPPKGNGIGDACECEGNFDCDQDCDGSDAATFKAHFGRGTYNRPCTNADPCDGDFTCDVDVDGSDAAVFKKDFGRSQYFNPCLSCATGKWCCY